MYRFPRVLTACCAVAIHLAGCASDRVMHYVVSSHSPYLCCRTIRYATAAFAATQSSSLAGDGVAVRLLADTIRARCADGAHVDIVIANNTDQAIYVPFSNDLEGDRIKLYPFRLLYEGDHRIRLARQLQYNDVVERLDSKVLFYRLPAGKQTTLHASVQERWLCSALTTVTKEYLALELNPTFYSDRVRGLREGTYRRDPNLLRTSGFCYEIAYTRLGYLDSLPVQQRSVNSRGDTTTVQINVKEEPGTFLDASQHVARSNEAVLMIEDN
ncbi:MAG: hypothetical protein JST22_08510 [Bacteroidetes bacterium]|nr:hypothetical protein [Bacteroidota bacterium]